MLTTTLALVASTLANVFALEVEPNHSTIGFSVPIAGGITRVTGKFMRLDVRMTYEAEDLSEWSVEATLDVSSIDTGIDARDEDLRGPSFFDTTAHPKITFVSRKIERRGDNHVALGELTMRGATKTIEIPFRITQVSWEDGRPSLGVAASLSVNRNDYGVGTGWKHTAIPNFIGDEVTVEIFFWTKRGKPLEVQEGRKKEGIK